MGLIWLVLAAIAARTSRIKLGSAVTVLSSDDPIRVFQRFSTLNAVSNGRAEVILGRGSFTESYPLFGYALGLAGAKALAAFSDGSMYLERYVEDHKAGRFQIHEFDIAPRDHD